MSYSNAVANFTRSHKLLNDVFDSFAEAYDAFAALVGNENDELSPKNMVRHFLAANQLPIFGLDSSDYINASIHYFSETQWVSVFLEKHGFFQYDDDQFLALDRYNRPVGFLRVLGGEKTLLQFSGILSKDLYDALWAAVRENIKLDTTEPPKDDSRYYYETVIEKNMFGEGLVLKKKEVQHPGHTHNAFYPYLDGGIVNLIEDFIASDETVLILMGEPGTGKSTAISSAAAALNLMPIYVKKKEVIEYKDFISSIFSFSDNYMEKAQVINGAGRDALFKERKIFDQMATQPNLPTVEIGVKRKEPSVPVIIVEDGDLLIAPRSHGNEMMAELLNETDGVGSAITRKMIITTNLTDKNQIEPALMRDGRHYLGEPLHFRLLTPMEAIEARAAAGLPAFEVTPSENISLAKALRKPRKKIYLKEGEIVVRERSKLN